MYYEKYTAEYDEYSIGSLAIIVSHKNNPVLFDKDFYSYCILVTFSGDGQHYRVAQWCKKNCQDKWLVGIEESYFVNEEDAMAFKLTWA